MFVKFEQIISKLLPRTQAKLSRSM